mgnify:CR=1 FL=1
MTVPISAINTGFYNALKLWPEAWATTTAFAVGDVVQATTYNAHAYKCTTAGTTGGTEPTWGTTNGGTTADGTVTWTCYDSKTYNVRAPQGSTVPYVTFSMETDIPIGTFEDMEEIESLTFWVNCFSDKSTADVAEIADEVLVVLDNASLTVTGYTAMVCRREFIGTTIWDLETGIFQIPLRYRVQLSL